MCEATVFAWLNTIRKQCIRRDEPLTIVEGDAPGVDSIAAKWACNNPDVTLRSYPADWNPGGVFDQNAGKKRNQQMLDEMRPDRLIAFGDLERPSRRRSQSLEGTGTLDMVKRANRAGIRVTIIAKPGDLP
jgi:hypothetical protein